MISHTPIHLLTGKKYFTHRFSIAWPRAEFYSTIAFVAAPQCSPSRAAILTGRQIWQLEEAGTHASLFPNKFPVFTDALGQAGYFIGFTGKPWAPGNYEAGGWKRNPVGPEYNKRQLSKQPTTGISKTDYVANFKDFLADKPGDEPSSSGLGRRNHIGIMK